MIEGVLLVICGGLMEGSFSLPLKHAGQWNWENIWGVGSLAALLLIPWPLALATVPHLGLVYADSTPLSLILAILFGAGWGIGGIFFGLGVSAVGISLGTSLIMGLVAVGGSIIPLLMQSPGELLEPAGIVLMGGVALMIIGVSTCATAGRMKSAPDPAVSVPNVKSPSVSFAKGLTFCILAGLLSALVNLALIFGKNIADSAIRQGAEPANATNAIWAIVFTTNYLLNIAYCLYRMQINRSFRLFGGSGDARNWLGALSLGLVWAAGIVVYGSGASRLGHLGAYLGFPIMLISSVLTGNFLGVVSGEWKGVPNRPKITMVMGVAFLLIAIIVLGRSASLAG
jgi:L-rhamnose-H+ transport protein